MYRYESTAREVTPLTLLINPTYHSIKKAGNSIGWECCFSIPSMAGEVRRYNAIHCEYYDQSGTKQSLVVRGFLARLVQHEIAHLQGITYNLELAKSGRFLAKQEATEIVLAEYKP